MRQVPCYGIIGDGRLARHFCHYLGLLGISYRQWTRRHSEAPEALLDACDPILLLISDDAITPFIADHPNLLAHTLCHCCASLEVPGVYSVHPLMTFGPALYEDALYSEIPFVVSDNGPAFEELFPGLPNQATRISPDKKALYHTLCVLSGNFTVILWQKALRDFSKRLGISHQLLQPYCKQIFKNLLTDPFQSLTGPIARNDVETMKRQLSTLKGDPFFDVYQAIANAYLEENQLS